MNATTTTSTRTFFEGDDLSTFTEGDTFAFANGTIGTIVGFDVRETERFSGNYEVVGITVLLPNLDYVEIPF